MSDNLAGARFEPPKNDTQAMAQREPTQARLRYEAQYLRKRAEQLEDLAFKLDGLPREIEELVFRTTEALRTRP